MLKEELKIQPIREILHPEIARIEIFRSKEETALAAAGAIALVVEQNPTATITFATGNTMVPVYKELAKLVERGEVDFSRTTAFHLDEYYPADPDKEDFSFVRYLRELVWKPLHIGTVFELNGLAKDGVAEAKQYDKLLRSHPVDLAILGIGPWSDKTQTGCHVAFNESGTPFDMGGHLAQLDVTTIQRDQVDRGQASPGMALTQGIGNILEARSILLVAYGEDKGQSLRQALTQEISPQRPASAIRMVGDKVTIFGDFAVGKVLDAH
ncbi:MAG: Glucosamine-6-phosphate deaminase [Candidatus Gottesmanbacteria bacterium GW2011_GWA2_42_16]|nr:MAG: Glucosamine-6-phosphate deaminase [Candidatus Gottesmanbacteria bacterium GW2011_GWA2_42_16]HCM82633.1 hypothetical protein [Patescibacteria group bacterium]